MQFVVELSGAVSSEVVVSYATSDGTGAHPAAAGTDYTAVSATTLTFRPGEALRRRRRWTVATSVDDAERGGRDVHGGAEWSDAAGRSESECGQGRGGGGRSRTTTR